MEIRNNEDLSKWTTFHVGGMVRNFYIPESEYELISLVRTFIKNQKPFKVLSGGSNILINDKKVFENVIYMGYAAEKLIDNGGGHFYIGASNRIQKVIHYLNNNGYGGFEELIGLPALFGGIIYMNAGIGGKNCVIFNISDFIENVNVINIRTGELEYIKTENCLFDYRKSIFQEDGYIIIGANIFLKKQDMEESTKKINQRIQFIRNVQEWGKGCFGSCFSECNGRILRFVKLLHTPGGGIPI